MRAARQEFLWLVRNSRKPRMRTIREFAEQEIVLPDGKFEGFQFSCKRQPWSGLWFALIAIAAAMGWRRFVFLGPRQTGKTLLGFVIPLLYFLLEVLETVIAGVPSGTMAGDKWRENIKPVIEKSRYADLLPTSGKGSKGGDEPTAFQFGHGPTLKFMTAGTGDKGRAGFTSRCLFVTETDEFDKSASTSEEADKLTQMEHCLDSYSDQAIEFLECTVTTEGRRTWREYQAGTCSSVRLMCPYCQCWVTPEREHFVGWQEAKTLEEARANGHFICPNGKCAKAWSDEDRVVANVGGRVVHRGQEIQPGPEGEVVGEAPKTNTLSFRVSATNNLFWSMADIAEREWKAARDPDQENAEREMLQFVWSLPFKGAEEEASKISIQGIQARAGQTPRGHVPDSAVCLVSAIDLGRWRLHWVTAAFDAVGTMHIVDYGVIAVSSGEMAEEQAVLLGLREWRDLCEAGWGWKGVPTSPACAILDAAGGDKIVEAAYAFIDETSGGRAAGPNGRTVFYASKGHGFGQHKSTNYSRPVGVSERCKYIGEGYHIAILERKPPIYEIHVDDDFWKTWIHARVHTPAETAGSFHLFAAGGNDHLTYAKQLSAEQRLPEWDPKRGRVLRWVAKYRENHYLDGTKLCGVAGNMLGVKVVRGEVPPRPPRKRTQVKSDWLGSASGGGAEKGKWI
ncbi:MAG: phage terminase large subunit family protein [Phycisphaerales bacterium]|nr:phage terminase large subunit family protein [Phycisphaerales bacterium]